MSQNAANKNAATGSAPDAAPASNPAMVANEEVLATPPAPSTTSPSSAAAIRELRAAVAATPRRSMQVEAVNNMPWSPQSDINESTEPSNPTIYSGIEYTSSGGSVNDSASAAELVAVQPEEDEAMPWWWDVVLDEVDPDAPIDESILDDPVFDAVESGPIVESIPAATEEASVADPDPVLNEAKEAPMPETAEDDFGDDIPFDSTGEEIQGEPSVNGSGSMSPPPAPPAEAVVQQAEVIPETPPQLMSRNRQLSPVEEKTEPEASLRSDASWYKEYAYRPSPPPQPEQEADPSPKRLRLELSADNDANEKADAEMEKADAAEPMDAESGSSSRKRKSSLDSNESRPPSRSFAVPRRRLQRRPDRPIVPYPLSPSDPAIRPQTPPALEPMTPPREVSPAPSDWPMPSSRGSSPTRSFGSPPPMGSMPSSRESSPVPSEAEVDNFCHACGRGCGCPRVPPADPAPQPPAVVVPGPPPAPRRRPNQPEFGQLWHIKDIEGANLPQAPPVVIRPDEKEPEEGEALDDNDEDDNDEEEDEEWFVDEGANLNADQQIGVVRGKKFAAALYTSGDVVLKGEFDAPIASALLKEAKNQAVMLYSDRKHPIKELAAGDDHLMMLSTTGRLFTVGRYAEGQLGVTRPLNKYRPSNITPKTMLRQVLVGGINTKVDSIWADHNLSVAVLEDGSQYGCGEGGANVFTLIE